MQLELDSSALEVPYIVSHKVFSKSFCRSQLLRKSVNLSITITNKNVPWEAEASRRIARAFHRGRVDSQVRTGAALRVAGRSRGRGVGAFRTRHTRPAPAALLRAHVVMRAVHLGRPTCHAISGRGDSSTRIPDSWLEVPNHLPRSRRRHLLSSQVTTDSRL